MDADRDPSFQTKEHATLADAGDSDEPRLGTRPAYRILGGRHSPAPRSVDTANHFLGQAMHLVSRLRDHIERIDSGVPYAVDDLAVTMRAMLATGRGNDVLGRLHRMSGMDVQIQLSRAPRSADIRFSLGSLPVCGVNARDDGATWVPLERWAHTPLLHIRTDRDAKFTWGRFLDSYANKWGGAHLDREVPLELKVIDMYEAGDHLLSAYLMRTAAVQIWHIAQEFLMLLVGPQIPGLPTDIELVALASEGGITKPPTNRRGAGELQFLDYTGDQCQFLVYHDGISTTSIRFAAGGSLTYDFILQGRLGASPSEPQRARAPAPPKEPIKLSATRTLQNSGRVRLFGEVDPVVDATSNVRAKGPATGTGHTVTIAAPLPADGTPP